MGGGNGWVCGYRRNWSWIGGGYVGTGAGWVVEVGGYVGTGGMDS